MVMTSPIVCFATLATLCNLWCTKPPCCTNPWRQHRHQSGLRAVTDSRTDLPCRCLPHQQCPHAPGICSSRTCTANPKVLVRCHREMSCSSSRGRHEPCQGGLRFLHIERAAMRLDAVRGERWVVVTSVAPPTADLHFLASLPGWRVVVAGDAKTPPSWQHPNCVYLSLERQRSLGLETVDLLPEGSYSRKNAGFLYAIAHGARVLYETDDDNRPLDGLRNFLLEPTTSGLAYVGKDRFNPYRHFGQATLWPRGYPLGDVGEEPNSSYVLGRWKTPSIQQGLVNGDPDMDAIFRLTRKKTLQVLNVTFDGSAPPAILPAGVFAPYNSQNTLYLHDALWATLLPTTTTFRLCDIWRGYWAQRLLWEVGGTLGFLAPNAFQKRNAHSYMADAADEEDMYFHTEDLVAFLRRWRCRSSLSFFGCVERLSWDMADAGFWGPADARLAEAWVRDLRRVNYTEPERICRESPATAALGAPLDQTSQQRRKNRNESAQVSCDGVASSSRRDINVDPGAAAGLVNNETQIVSDVKVTARVRFWATEQEPPTIHEAWTMDRPLWKHVDGIRKLCPNESLVLPPLPRSPTQRPTRQSDVLLVVVFNFFHYDNIPTLQAMYGYHFPLILFCGNSTEAFVNASRSFTRQASFVEAPIKEGFLAYLCLLRAMEMNYRVKGYLLIGDDTLVNPWNVRDLDRDRFWFHSLKHARRQQPGWWYWWDQPNGRTALNRMWIDLDSLKRRNQTAAKSIGEFMRMTNLNYHSRTNATVEDGAFRGFSDFVYIPDKFKGETKFYLELLAAREVFLEIALPTVLAGLSPIGDIVTVRGEYTWQNARKAPQDFYSYDHVFLHPVKISFLQNDNYLWRKFFCQKFLAALLHL